MTRTIATIQGELIRYFAPSGLVTFFGDADIDCDGSGGNPDGDPYFQPDTSYHFQGKALDAYHVPFIVVPPQIIKGVSPIVLGCLCHVTDMRTGKRVVGLVGDIGPISKIGEVSVAAARILDIPASPVSGGVDEVCFQYKLWPGIPAVIGQNTYPLQPS